MTEESRPIRTLAVLGGGITGLSAALAFGRALPRVQICLVSTPADPANLVDRLSGSLPPIHRFHASIGLDELDLIRSGVAHHHLGTWFEGWSRSGRSWFHGFGEHGLAAGGIPFHQLWSRLRKADGTLSFDRYSAATWLADAGKFVHPQDDVRSPLSTYLYALRLNPEHYRAHLLALTGQHRIEHVEGEFGGAERREDGGVARLRLKDGRSFEADLFLDCSGPSAPLRSVLDADFDDWRDSLPCDRLLLGSSTPPPAPLPSGRVCARPGGWSWTSTVPDRTMTGFAYGSSFIDEATARRLMRSGETDRADAVAIRPGRRPEPWKHNVLALGDAAVAIDPLHETALHMAQSAILRALELLPGRDCHPLELREYNRRSGLETMRVRDFLALHYLRSGRVEGEFWRAAADLRPPESLAHTLDQFEARGRLPFYEEESFEQQSWLAALLGIGVLPNRTDPVAERVDVGEANAGMQRLADRLAGLAAKLPSYSDYLTRMAETRHR